MCPPAFPTGSSTGLICCSQTLSGFGDPLPWDKALPLPSQALQIPLGVQHELQPQHPPALARARAAGDTWPQLVR